MNEWHGGLGDAHSSNQLTCQKSERVMLQIVRCFSVHLAIAA